MSQIESHLDTISSEENSMQAHILIINHEVESRQFLITLLSGQGYFVDWVENGEQALAKVQASTINLILLNTHLPTKSGYEICKSLKANHDSRLIPIIFISEQGLKPDKTLLYSSGGVDFIEQPFHEGEVLARIATQLALQTAEQKIERRTKQYQDEIAERKIVVDALRISEERLRIISNISNDGIYDWNILTNEIWGNEAYIERFLIPDPTNVDREWIENIHLDDRELVTALWEQTINGDGLEWKLEYRYKHIDGSYRWLNDNARIIRDRDGKAIQVLGSITDITERKQMLASLRQSEEKYRNILDTIQESYYENDLAGNLLFFNHASVTLLGYSREELMGMNYRDYTDKETARVLFKVGRKVIETGKSVNAIEWRVIRKDGTERFISMSIILRRDAEGNPIGFQGISRDVTERKQAEEQRLQLLIECERVQLLTNFIEKASHEFRTPLATLQTSIYLLNKTSTQEKAKQRLSQMKEKVKSLTRLVDDLVMMARLDGNSSFTQEILQIPGILQNVASDLQSRVDEQGLSFQMSIDKELPAILGNNKYLHLVFKNIVGNAIRYTSDSGAVTIRAYHEKNSIIIEVEDTGIGMNEEHLQHIFERFYRADEAHSTRGFGLGLPIAKKIIEDHRGQITVESILTQGTIFKIILPVKIG